MPDILARNPYRRVFIAVNRNSWLAHVESYCAGEDLVFPETLTQGPVEVGNDVWVGARASILPGVKIGDGAVITAGAFVIEDVPPFGVVEGVPSRVLKHCFPPDVLEGLLKVRRWEWEESEFLRNAEALSVDPQDF